jgi:hypothetical protein
MRMEGASSYVPPKLRQGRAKPENLMTTKRTLAILSIIFGSISGDEGITA